MSKRTLSLSTRRPSALRTRAAVLAAGMGASVVLGAGVAFADDAVASSNVLAAPAASIAAQAEAQAKAAAVAKQAAQAKKAAEVKKAALAKKAKKAKKKAANPAWTNPVAKYTLSASFGLGGNMWSQKHSGQDYAVPVGTSVKAAGSGTVVKAGPNGGGDGPAYGNAVVIKHSNGKYSQYAHLSKIKVSIGQKVKTNQQIALSGNTGNSSGPHLHFEIRTTPNYGSAVNPVAFLRSAGVQL
ncbi:M23 family metallopeptidase [Streptomyces sp. A3M-1-3]|uniref:M23 family metallopeptidase n=1 Tax=Streptomyces sp. A3M-1-3 TaxID=2962044 RepID=UPI0020B88ED8|nr:M23 family metallopeptidase [Streptomyces sp. A3M-1-3]MCP3822333.1 M23 family metallopeptidase [Streptomyces sp. A3M-1-3]